ncbi:hypothetical protein CYMTET_9622 [Cymbomonas tetramitiformis]|uniref:Uncharacterized protein n=1 Tax=Cymbomonas tetramitiformis TaxID=36881 RepID=A0AAE0GSD2_9CHLO|nr:hypothetical protein CYMTET_9622 [Cymbomonas tetramitiformis]
MSHLMPANLNKSNLSKDGLHQSSVKLSENLTMQDLQAKGLPTGGMPLNRPRGKKQFQHSGDLAHTAKISNLGGSSLHVHEADDVELGATGGIQRLKVEPRELFMTEQGKPPSDLARDRQLAGVMSAHAQSSRVYIGGEGYSRPGIWTDQ